MLNAGRRFVAMSASFMMVLASSAAYAEDGQIAGRVLNAETKEPIPDVVITVTSPKLQWEEIVVTDSAGNFRLVNLPIKGSYTVGLDAGSAFKPASRTGIRLTSEKSIRLEFLLSPEENQPKEPPMLTRRSCWQYEHTDYDCLLSNRVTITVDEKSVRRLDETPLAPPGTQNSELAKPAQSPPAVPRKCETPIKKSPKTTHAPSAMVKLTLSQDFFRRVPFLR